MAYFYGNVIWYTPRAARKSNAAHWNETSECMKFSYFHNELWDLAEILLVYEHKIEAKERSVLVGTSTCEVNKKNVPPVL